MEGHTSVALEDQGNHERLIQSNQLPTLFTPVQATVKILRDHSFESPSEVPLVRLLKRLKLNPSGSRGQDPLLQA